MSKFTRLFAGGILALLLTANVMAEPASLDDPAVV